MGTVFGLGVLMTLTGAGNWLGRWRYDRRHETRPNHVEISRFGFVYPPLKVALAACGLGAVLLVVGGVGYLV